MSIFDEISILYNKQDKELLAFLEKHPAQKVTLVITDVEDFIEAQGWKIVNAIHEKYADYNINVCFYKVRTFTVLSEALIDCMKQLQVPYYTGCIVVNFDQLNYLCEQGVSEVYLAEDICFDLRGAKRVCKRFGVQIRAFPNVGQASVKAGPALKKFFIRPEDVELYAEYIDTLEFWGPPEKQGILHKIYNQGYWFGDLKEIILDFDLSFDSRRIMPGFALARIDCGRKCMKGGQCAICDRILNISKKLEEQDLIIRKSKSN